MAGFPAAYDCIEAFSETDFTEDLKKIDVPTLIMHGDGDQIVPIGAAAMLSSKIIKDATLRVYQGATRTLHDTEGSGERRSARLRHKRTGERRRAGGVVSHARDDAWRRMGAPFGGSRLTATARGAS